MFNRSTDRSGEQTNHGNGITTIISFNGKNDENKIYALRLC